MKTMIEYKLANPEQAAVRWARSVDYTYKFNMQVYTFLKNLGFPNFWLSEDNDTLGIIAESGVMRLYSVEDVVPEESNPNRFEVFFSSTEVVKYLEKIQPKSTWTQESEDSEDVYAVVDSSDSTFSLDGVSLDEAKKAILDKFDPTDWAIYKRVSGCNKVHAYEFPGC